MKEGIKPVTVEQLRVKGFDDNFSYLLYTPEGDAAIVDPTGNVDVILSALRNAPLELIPRYILITHSHRDHISALADVLKTFPAPVTAHPEAKVNADITVNDGQLLPFGSIAIECIYTPGHTNDSICYRTTDDSALFTGDTLFIDWCGYCNAKTMFKTMREKLYPLAGSLVVWSGHDYGHIPYATLGEEKNSNPYLRSTDFASFKEELKKIVKSILISLLIAFVLVIIGAIIVYEKKQRTGFAAKLELGLGLAAFLVGLFISASSIGLLILNRMEQRNAAPKAIDSSANVSVPRKTSMQKRIEYLQKFVPAGALASSDPRFMTFAGSKSAPRMPMVFPYELRIDPIDEEALVGMHTGEAPVDDPKSIEVIIKDIVSLNLDNQFMVAKVKAATGDKEDKYILFSFKNGTSDSCKTEEELWKAASDAGYSGPEILIAPMKLREEYFRGTPDF